MATSFSRLAASSGDFARHCYAHMASVERTRFREHRNVVALQQHAVTQELHERAWRAADLVIAEWLGRRSSGTRDALLATSAPTTGDGHVKTLTARVPPGHHIDDKPDITTKRRICRPAQKTRPRRPRVRILVRADTLNDRNRC